MEILLILLGIVIAINVIIIFIKNMPFGKSKKNNSFKTNPKPSNVDILSSLCSEILIATEISIEELKSFSENKLPRSDYELIQDDYFAVYSLYLYSVTGLELKNYIAILKSILDEDLFERYSSSIIMMNNLMLKESSIKNSLQAFDVLCHAYEYSDEISNAIFHNAKKYCTILSNKYLNKSDNHYFDNLCTPIDFADESISYMIAFQCCKDLFNLSHQANQEFRNKYVLPQEYRIRLFELFFVAFAYDVRKTIPKAIHRYFINMLMSHLPYIVNEKAQLGRILADLSSCAVYFPNDNTSNGFENLVRFRISQDPEIIDTACRLHVTSRYQIQDKYDEIALSKFFSATA